MSRSKRAKQILIYILIFLLLIGLFLFGEEAYHQIMVRHCAEEYKKTGDISVLVKGYDHLNVCVEVGTSLHEPYIFYTKALADCGEWNDYYADSAFGKENGPLDNPELVMKATYLALLLVYNDFDVYLNEFGAYYSSVDITEHPVFLSVLSMEDIVDSENWEEIYLTVKKGFVSLAEAQTDKRLTVAYYTDLSVYCELVGEMNDSAYYQDLSDTVREEFIESARASAG